MTVELIRQLKDELGLQAWLAGAELRNPSLAHEETRNEVDALVRMRDELRLQLHLGKLEAKEEFEKVEGQWQKVKAAASKVADDAGDGLTDLLSQIRSSYRKLRPE